MQVLDSTNGSRLVHFHRASAALDSLYGTSNADRFHGWRGRSGRRYTMTVHAVDGSELDAGLPLHDAFVLVSVKRDGPSAHAVAVAVIEREIDRRLALARGLAAGVDEWHVHLLAVDRRARAAAVADLSARHVLAPPLALTA